MSIAEERGARTRPISPYKGLAPFEDSELDELLFFGRERERDVIGANLVAARLTVLYGPSGVGKTSILAAAVVRDLRALPEQPLVVVHTAWAEDPVGALAEAVAAAAGVEAQSLGEAVELACALHGELYLVLDQVEEYFVYHGADPALGDALAELGERPELRVHVLIGVREDALARLDAFKSRLPGLLANRVRLDHLTRDAGRRAIVGPIERFGELVPEEEGLAVEPGLVEAVLDGVRAGAFLSAARGRGVAKRSESRHRIETPYLQVVMQRLWEVERAEGSRVLRLRTLERLGGPGRIVEEHLERALAALTPAQKQLAARMFNHLVTPSGMKIAHGDADLAGYAAASQEEVAPVLDVLGRERILRPVDSGHEIYHDVLADAVLAWRGRFEAERLLESERAAGRRRHRRLLVVVAAAVAVAAAMAALAVWAFAQRSDARRNAAAASASARLAQANEEAAKQSASEAKAQQAEAEKQAQEAEKQRRLAAEAQAQAEASAARAEQESEVAQQQKQLADASAAEAQQQAARAEHESQAALAARRVALGRQREASRQAKIALAQRARALAQERIATANADAARALTLIDAHPVESVRAALKAIQLVPSAAHVDVLRQAVVHDRLRAVLPGGGSVKTAVFDPTGSLVVTASTRGGARLFRSDGRLVRKLGPAAGAAFSPDGTLVATWGADGARLWSTRTDARAASLGGGPVYAVSFSTDGKLVATAGVGGARVWTPAGEPVATLPHDGKVTAISFDRAGERAVTVAEDSGGRLQARIFDAHTGALLQLLPERGIRAAVFSPDGSLVATGSNDHTARLWDSSTGEEKARMTEDGQLVAVEFSRDGKLLVAANAAGGAAVWDVPAGTLHSRIVGVTNRVVDAQFSPDGRYIVIASLDRTARVYRVSDGLQAAKLAGHTDSVTGAAFGPTSRSVVTASADGTARVWDTGVADLLRTIGTHDGAVNVGRFSPDGRLVVSAGADKTARIWRLAGGPALVLPHDGAVEDAVFSPDGKLVLTGADDGTARLWRSSDGALLRPLAAGANVLAVAFAPDGKTVATAGADGNVILWRTADGARLHVLPDAGKPVETLAFSPGGTLLATAGRDNTARLWRVATGAQLHVLQGHSAEVLRIAFSPDGSRVVTASADGTARLWSAATGKQLAVLTGHTFAVNDARFSPNGRLILTASLDSDARLWDGRTGRPGRVLRGHFGNVQEASFSPDGRWIVTAGPLTAGIWQTASGELFASTGSADPYLRGPTLQLTSASFGPDGHRILVTSKDGSVRTYFCGVCGGVGELRPLARALLRDGTPR